MIDLYFSFDASHNIIVHHSTETGASRFISSIGLPKNDDIIRIFQSGIQNGIQSILRQFSKDVEGIFLEPEDVDLQRKASAPVWQSPNVSDDISFEGSYMGYIATTYSPYYGYPPSGYPGYPPYYEQKYLKYKQKYLQLKDLMKQLNLL